MNSDTTCHTATKVFARTYLSCCATYITDGYDNKKLLLYSVLRPRLECDSLALFLHLSWRAK